VVVERAWSREPCIAGQSSWRQEEYTTILATILNRYETLLLSLIEAAYEGGLAEYQADFQKIWKGEMNGK